MSSPTKPSPVGTWTSVFAAVTLLVVGIFQFLQGLVAVIDGRTFLVATPRYFLAFNETTWGWIHLLLGVVVALAGFFILRGNVAARAVGIALAGLQAVVNFVWLPWYPIWAILIIAVDILVIWALATTRLDDTAEA